MAAQAPAQPPATQTPDPVNWECHVCANAGPINYTREKKCATCGHSVCDKCKKDNKIPPPNLSTTAARVHSSPTATARARHAQDPDIWPTSQVPRPRHHVGTTNTNARSRSSLKLSSRPHRPSPRGWWRCSECRNVNNPDLTSGRCTSCNHIKCASCVAVRNG